MSAYKLNPERFFDSDREVRKYAIELYDSVKDLPIISPHGHVDPVLLAENRPFSDPTELFLIPDHYILRLLYSQGIPMEDLGVPRKDGGKTEIDHKKIWQIFADHYYLFAGTPTGAWLDYEFFEVFGISERLNRNNAAKIYDQLQEKLISEEFLPRALYDRFNIEVLATTDSAVDSLEFHQKLQKSDWNGRMIPTFRPDSVFNIASSEWIDEIAALHLATGIVTDTFSSFICALESRREYFKDNGATATDQGILSPYTHELSYMEVNSIFKNALKGNVTKENAEAFIAHMIMEMARMSTEDGLVMQLHPGSFRNHNDTVFRHFGADKGADIPVKTEYTRNLHELLNKYGNDTRLTLIVFTLDETAYSRELAPLAGHYPAMKLGPSWWFHDSIQGMTRFREQVSETATIYNTVGFNDDTRAFPSIPARHDLSRRVDSNWLAGLVARHIIGMEEAFSMSRALAYDLVKKAYKL